MKFNVFYTRLTVTIIAFLIVSNILLYRSAKKNRNQKEIYRNDLAIYKDGLETMRDKNGHLITKNGILQLRIKDMKEMYDKDVVQTLKDMNIRLRKMESISFTGIESTHEIKTTLRDSIRIVDVEMQPIKYIDYKSEWLDFYQLQIGDRVEIKIAKRDSIIQVVYEPRKMGFILFRPFKKKPPLEQKIKMADPNTIVKYNKYIIPIKKRD
ncbi:hypothetical protein ES704_03654 [subsurface metagenome]|jgi:hypothetical protein